jgi:hypothetical protein
MILYETINKGRFLFYAEMCVAEPAVHFNLLENCKPFKIDSSNFDSVLTPKLVYILHCKKRLSLFPSPSGMSLTKLSLEENS